MFALSQTIVATESLVQARARSEKKTSFWASCPEAWTRERDPEPARALSCVRMRACM